MRVLVGHLIFRFPNFNSYDDNERLNYSLPETAIKILQTSDKTVMTCNIPIYKIYMHLQVFSTLHLEKTTPKAKFTRVFPTSSLSKTFPLLGNFQRQGLEGGRYHRGACRLPCSQWPHDCRCRCTERSEGTEGSCEAHGGHQTTIKRKDFHREIW